MSIVSQSLKSFLRKQVINTQGKEGVKMKKRRKQTDILVLGAGFGGICTAKYLLKFTKKIPNVKIVQFRNYWNHLKKVNK